MNRRADTADARIMRTTGRNLSTIDIDGAGLAIVCRADVLSKRMCSGIDNTAVDGDGSSLDGR